jgi:acetoin utilization protein AcuB
MLVKDAMTRDPFTIDPEAPLGTAMDVMRTRGLRHLPVVDEAGRLIGIISDRDLRHAAFGPAIREYLSASAQRQLRQLGDTFENLKVRDAMTWVVVTTRPDAVLGYAALLMWERRLGGLPVIDDDDRLVGMLTERDILRAVAREERVGRVDPEGFLW